MNTPLFIMETYIEDIVVFYYIFFVTLLSFILNCGEIQVSYISAALVIDLNYYLLMRL